MRARNELVAHFQMELLDWGSESKKRGCALMRAQPFASRVVPGREILQWE